MSIIDSDLKLEISYWNMDLPSLRVEEANLLCRERNTSRSVKDLPDDWYSSYYCYYACIVSDHNRVQLLLQVVKHCIEMAEYRIRKVVAVGPKQKG
jgi:hypothetical protein